MGGEGCTRYFEENHQGIQSVVVYDGLKGEGLEDAIPDVFQLHVSKVDQVCDEIYPSIELA